MSTFLRATDKANTKGCTKKRKNVAPRIWTHTPKPNEACSFCFFPVPGRTDKAGCRDPSRWRIMARFRRRWPELSLAGPRSLSTKYGTDPVRMRGTVSGPSAAALGMDAFLQSGKIGPKFMGTQMPGDWVSADLSALGDASDMYAGRWKLGRVFFGCRLVHAASLRGCVVSERSVVFRIS